MLRSRRKSAALPLLLDGVKGWLPAALVQWKRQAWGLSDGAHATVGLAAFLGPPVPAVFQVSGRQGVATAACILLGSAEVHR